jgi:putative membrane protein
MKKFSLLVIAGTVSFTFKACQSKKDSTSTADSINKSNDTISKSVDTVKAGAMTVDKDDAKFAVVAANGGLAEVMLGKLAQDKGGTQVKDFAGMMVKDHSKANEELMILAKSKNITLPSVLNKDEQKIFDDLNKKVGADFDKSYVKGMVDDHKNDVKEFDEASKNLKDADLKAFASKNLPVLKMHLAAVSKIDSLMNKK